MEESGAVFLPAAGYNDHNWCQAKDVQKSGLYWSASELNDDDEYNADYLFFASREMDVNIKDRSLGQSVRLVKDL